MKRTTSLLLALALPLALLATVSAAQTQRGGELIERAMKLTPNPRRGAQLYQELCTTCHGAQAQGNALTATPVLASQGEHYLVKQLIDMSEGDRNVPEMHRLMSVKRLSTPQAVRDLASYLHGLSSSSIPELGDGEQLAVGAQLYADLCAECHGRKAEGIDSEALPALRAQHYSYLLGQLRRLTVSHRYSIDIAVLQGLEMLSFEQLTALSDYLSRLPPSKQRE
jgi:cytochrome c553